MNISENINQLQFQKYLTYLKSTGLSDASIKRKLSSLSSFQKFLIKKKILVPSSRDAINRVSTTPVNQQLPDSKINSFNPFKNFKFKIVNYVAIATVLILLSGLGYTVYSQTILQARKNLAYSTAANLTTPNRILSFQGRLTDSSGNPITSSTGIVFRLFNAGTGGTELYVSNTGNSQTVIPDENGIFSVVIGKSHGTGVPSTVFSENAEVWLEITAAGETMDPRQQIATVGYALNAETLQGLPPSASGEKDTVVIVDGLGNINLGETSPSIISTSGTFGLEGQAMLIKATDGSGGNITINPDGAGILKLITEGAGSTAVGGFIEATNANLASGNLFSGLIRNDNRGYNFIDFTNYNIGTTTLSSRFSVDASGTVTTSIGITAPKITLSVGASSGYILQSDASGNSTWVSPGSAGIGTSYDAGSGLTRTGSVFKFGGAITENTRLNIGNTEVLYINSANGNVGLGTTLPTYKLTVAAGDIGLDANKNIYWGSGATQSYLNVNSGFYRFYYNAAERLKFDLNASTTHSILDMTANLALGTSAANTDLIFNPNRNAYMYSGNLGIGTTSPTKKLDVAGDINLTGTIFSNGTSGTSGQVLSSTGTGLQWVNASSVGGTYVFSNGLTNNGTFVGLGGTLSQNTQIGTSSFSLSFLGLGGTQSLFIGATGYVGIGTANPQQMLHIEQSYDGKTSALIANDYSTGIAPYSVNGIDYGPLSDNARVGLIAVGSDSGKVELEANPLGTPYTNAGLAGLSRGAAGGGQAIGVFGFATNNTNTHSYSGGIYGGKFRSTAGSNFNPSGGESFYGLYSEANTALAIGGTTPNNRIYGLYGTAIGTTYTTGNITYGGYFNASGANQNFALYSASGTNYFSGNVGIGTTAPSKKLDIAGDINLTGTIFSNGTSGTSGQVLSSTGTGLQWVNASSVGGTYVFSNGLTNNGTFIGLGGTLTANTSISTSTFGLGIGVTGNSLYNLSVGGTANFNNLFASGRVGIGTTAPTVSLDVAGQAAINQVLTMSYVGNGGADGIIAYDGNKTGTAIFSLQRAASGATGTRLYGYNGIGFNPSTATGNNYKMVLDTAGNLGIGTTAPSKKLDITGDINLTGTIFSNGTSGTSGQVLSSTGTGLQWINASSVGGTYVFSNGLTNNGTFVGLGGTLTQNTNLTIGNTSVLFIGGTNGFVGLGTTSPGTKLHIQGADGTPGLVTFSNDNANVTSQIRGDNGNNYAGYYAGVSGSAGYTFDYSGNIRLGDGGGTRTWMTVNTTNHTVSIGSSRADLGTVPLFITNAGAVGIGTTGPTAKLTVKSRGSGDGIAFINSAGNTLGAKIFDSGSSNLFDLYGINGTTVKMRFQSAWHSYLDNGYNFGLGTTAPSKKLDIAGDINLTGTIFSNGTSGTSGQVLSSTGTGLQWVNASSVGGTYVFSNGLTNNGTFVGLGGTLTQNTQIGISSFSLTIGNNTASPSLYVSSNGKIGVGTSNPLYNLHIQGAGTQSLMLWNTAKPSYVNLYADTNQAYSAYAIGGFGGSGGYPIRAGVRDTVGYTIEHNTSTYMSIINGGNVGIGTTNPGEKLHIEDATRANFRTTFTNSGGQAEWVVYEGAAYKGGLSIFGSTFGTNQWRDALLLTAAADNTGSIIFRTKTSGTYNERMTLSNSGNVGIGTTAPGAYLNVSGTANNKLTITDSNAAVDGTTKTSSISFGTPDLYGNPNAIGAEIQVRMTPRIGLGGAPSNFGFLTQNNNAPYDYGERLTIKHNGLIGIGTTAPSKKLDVTGDINLTGTIFSNGTSGTSGQILTSTGTGLQWVNASSVGGTYVFSNGLTNNGSFVGLGGTLTQNTNLTIGNTSVLFLGTNGNVGIGTTSPSKKLDIAGDINLTGTIFSNGTSGTSGQVLSSTGTGLAWVNSSSVGGTYVFSNGLTNNGTFVGLGGILSTGTTINQNGNNLAFTGTGSLSIGTTDASRKFVVQGNSQINGDTWINGFLAVGSNQDVGFTRFGAQGLSIKVGDTLNSVVITGSGNVGIGTTSPTKKLDVTGDINLTGTIFSNGTSGTSGQVLSSTGTGLQWVNASSVGGTYVFSNGLTNNGTFVGLGGTLTQNTNLTIGNTSVLFLGTNGNVGIGTTTPGFKLDVAGGDINLASGQSLRFGSEFGISKTTAGKMNIYAGTGTNDIGGINLNYWTGSTYTPGISLSNTGNVGIGTTSPMSTLNIVTSTSNVSFNMQNSSSGYTTNDGAVISLDTNDLYITNRESGNVRLYNNGSERLRIDNSGNVGIGTTSPRSKLDVTVGNITLTKGYSLNWESSGFNGGSISLDGNNNMMFSTSTSVVERMRITAAGNVGIGTTNPSKKLDVAGDINLTGTIFSNGTSGTSGQVLSSTGTGLQWVNASSVGGTYVFNNGLTNYGSFVGLGGTLTQNTTINTGANSLSFLGLGNTQSLFISSNGNVGIGATNPGSLLQLKNNGVNDITGGITFNDNTYGLFRAFNSIVLQSGTGSGSGSVALAGASFEGYNASTNFKIAISANSPTTPIFIPNKNDPTTGIGSGNTGLLSLIAGGVNGLNVNSSGNVGLGTTAPSKKLDVVGDINLTGTIFSNGASGTSGQVLSSTGTGLQWVNASSVGGTYVFSNGLTNNGTFVGLGGTLSQNTTLNTNGFNLNIGQGNTQALFISSNGNVGIGTTNPAAKLSISNGNIYLDNNYGLYINNPTGSPIELIKHDSSYNFHIGAGNSNQLYLGESGTARLVLNTSGSGGATIQIGGTDVQIIDSAGNFKFNNGDVYFQNSTGNVGIGTTAPSKKLDVAGDINLTGTIFSNGTSGTSGQVLTSTGTGLQWVNATSVGGTYVFSNGLTNNGSFVGLGGTLTQNTNLTIGNTSVLFLGTNGNVGIGTTNPNAKLEIKAKAPAGSGATESMRLTGNSSNVANDGIRLNFALHDAATSVYGAAIDVIQSTTSPALLNPNMIFNINNNGWSEAMRINSSGYLGLGTTSPTSKLDVTGNVNITGNAYASGYIKVASIGSSINNFAEYRLGGSDAAYYGSAIRSINTQSSPSYLNPRLGLFVQPPSTFAYSNLVEAVSILGSGNVGIGTTAPSKKLDVAGDINLTGTIFSNGTSGTSGQVLSSTGTGLQWVNSSSVGGTYVFSNGLTNNGTFVGLGGTLTQNTNLTIGNTSALFIDSTSGYIGIGTTAPGYKLDVNGSFRANTLNIGVSAYNQNIANNLKMGTSSYISIGSGTVGTGAGGVTVTGVGTSFLTDFKKGDEIYIDSIGAAGVVTAIASDTSLTSDKYFGASSGSTYKRRSLIWQVTDSSNNLLWTINADGGMGFGGPTDGYVTTDYKFKARSGFTSGLYTRYYALTDNKLYANANANFLLQQDTTNGNITLETTAGASQYGLGYIDFKTKGLYQVRIGSSGNVGIGNTNPTAKLEISNTGSNTPGTNQHLVFSTAPGVPLFGFRMDTNNDHLMLDKNWSGWGTPALAVNRNTGNLGIGTTAPSKKLDVVGDINLTGTIFSNGTSGTSGQILSSTGTGLSWIDASGVGTTKTYYAGTGLSLDVGNTFSLNLGSSNTWTALQTFSGSIAIGSTGLITNLNADLLDGFHASDFVSVGTTGSFLYTASNGITQVGNDFRLGGNLTANTRLNIGNTEVMYFNTSGNVGIGTTSPTKKLDVAGDINLTGTIFSNGTSGTSGQVLSSTGTGLQWVSATGLGQTYSVTNGLTMSSNVISLGGTLTTDTNLTIGNTSVLFLGTNGNVGIGTTSPTQKLHILGSVPGNYVDALIENTGANGAAGFNFKNDVREWRLGVNANDDFRLRDETGNANIFTIQDGAGANALYITNTSNVGIGTSAPSKKLDVVGDINLTGTIFSNGTSGTSGQVLSSTGTGLQWVNASSVGGTYVFSNGLTNNGTFVGLGGTLTQNTTINTNGFNLNIGQGNTQALFISAVGNIGIGNTHYTNKLSVSGNAAFGTNYANVAAPTNGLLIEGSLGVGTTNTSGYKLNVESANRQGVYIGNNVDSTSAKYGVYLSMNNASGGGDNYGFRSTMVGTGGSNSYAFYADARGTGNNYSFYSYYGTLFNRDSVGIGTSSPTKKLDVTGDINLTGTIFSNGTSGTSGQVLSSTGTGLQWVNASSVGGTYTFTNGLNNIAGVVGLGGTLNQNTSLTIGDTSILYLSTNGNVGLGTTSPSKKLDVAGDINLTGTIFSNGTSGTSGQILSSTGTGLQWINASSVGTTKTYYAGTGLSLDVGNTFSLNLGSSNTWTALQTFSGSIAIGSTGLITNLNADLLDGFHASNFVSVGTTGSFLYTASNGITQVGNDFRLGGALTANTRLNIGNTEVMYFNTSGNVGIGTTNPSQKLDINGSINIGGSMTLTGSSIGTGTTALFVDSNGLVTKRALGAGAFSDGIGTTYSATNGLTLSSGAFGLGGTLTSNTTINTSGFNLNIGQGNTQALFISSGGNVGIGTTNPDNLLTINGSIHISGNASTAINLDNGVGLSAKDIGGTLRSIFTPWSDNNVYMGPAAGFVDTYLRAATGNINFAFGASNTTKATILNNGNVGIGTTNPLNKLTVIGAVGNNHGYFGDTNNGLVLQSNSGRFDLIGINYANNAFNNVYIRTGSASSQKGIYINTSGNVGIGTTAPSKKLDVTGDINLTGTIFSNGTSGTSGQVLSSTGTGLSWIDASGVGTTKTYYAGSGLSLDVGNTFSLNLGSSNTWTALQTFSGSIAIGTTSLVSNLNADLLDGFHASDFVAVGTTGTFLYTAGTGLTLSNTNVFSVDYDPANLSTTGNKLTTIQPINTSASPTFASLGLGTTNSLYLLNVGGTASFNNLFTSGSIGIGTTNPTGKLYVEGTGTFTGNVIVSSTDASNYLEIIDSGSHAFRIQTRNNAAALDFKTNTGTNIMSIMGGTTNVGIGTTAPSKKLDIAGDINLTGTIFSNGTSGTNGQVLSSTGTGLQWVNSAGVGQTYSVTNGLTMASNVISLGGTLTQNTKFSVGNTAAFFINSTTGNVGIGTSNATNKLEVALASNERVLLGTSGVASGLSLVNGSLTSQISQFQIVGTGSVPISFYTGGTFNSMTSGTEKMRLSTTGGLSIGNSYVASDPGAGNMVVSGYVGIGTTNPIGKLTVFGDGTTNAVNDSNLFSINDQNAHSLEFRYNQTENFWKLRTGTSAAPVSFSMYDSSALWINTNGNVGIGTTAPSKKLHVSGDINLTGTIFSNGTSGTSGHILSSTGTGLQWISTSGLGQTYTTDNGIHLTGSIIGLGGSLTASTRLNVGNTEVLYFSSAGNVGIGMTNPLYKFTVSGTQSNVTHVRTVNLTENNTTTVLAVGSTFSEADSGRIILWGDGTSRNIVGVNATSPQVIYIDSAANINATQSVGIYAPNLYVSSNGRVGINTTDNTAQLTVNGDIVATKFASIYDYSRYYLSPGNAASNSAALSLHGNGSMVFNTETIGGTQVTISASSSTRLKSFSNGFGIATNIGSTAAGATITWSEALFVKNNGNVGIGTTNPSEKLDLGSGNLTTTGQLISRSGSHGLSIRNSGNSEIIYTNINGGNGELSIKNSSFSERIKLNSNGNSYFNGGNVGIGTTAPSEKLNIKEGKLRFDHAGSNVTDIIALYNYSQSEPRVRIGYTGGGAPSSGYISLASVTNEKSIVLAGTGNSYINGGNVGIGTTAPGVKLEIAGDTSLKNDTTGVTLTIGGKAGTAWPYTIDTKTGAYLRILSANAGAIPFIMDSDGKIGIGNTNPLTPLSVTGSITVDHNGANTGTIANSLVFASNSGETIGSKRSAGGNQYGLDFYTSSANRMAILAGGNVGIGTTNPAYKLDVTGDIRSTSTIYANASGGKYFQGGDDASLNDVNLANTVGLYGVQDSAIGSLKLGSGGGTISGYNGNIGIGTTNPTGRLTISGTSGDNRSVSIDSREIKFRGDGVAHMSIYGPDSGKSFITFQNTSTNKGIGITGADLFTIFSNGNIGIGTTNPTNKLEVVDSGTNDAIKATQTSTGAAIIGINSSSGTAVYAWNTSTGYALYCQATGANKCGGNQAWFSASDRRLKENITPLTNSLAKVMGLQGVTYNMRNDPTKTSVMGFIAQDALPYVPEVVGLDAESGYYGMQTSQLTALLVNATQELNYKLTGLSITTEGQVNVDYNISEDVLASLGYQDSKNEIESAIYSHKINTGFIKTINLVAQNIVAETTKSKVIKTDIIAPLDDITDTIVIDGNIKAKEASFSTVYADKVISKEGEFGQVMTDKITALRDEIRAAIASTESPEEATPSAILAESAGWTYDVATSQVTVTGDMSLTDNLVVGSKLIVVGDTQLGNAFVTGTFTAGEIAIKDNFIETTNTALYIQPSGLGSVNIMNNALVIAENGEVTLSGNLTVGGNVGVSGSLFASLINADEINTKKINVATDSASAPIIAESGFAQLATNSAQVDSNATAGIATLPAGKTELIINNSKITPTSIIYLTPAGSTNNQVVYLKSKTTTGFTIAIDQALTTDIQINWWIIN